MIKELSRGARIHNRREKAAAVREHRTPVLLRPSTVESSRKTIRFIMAEHQPSFQEIMSASEKLAAYCEGIGVEDVEVQYLGDAEAREILRGLQEGIETGRVLSRQRIAKEVAKLGTRIGDYGASTGINEEIYGVLGAIQVNSRRITN